MEVEDKPDVTYDDVGGCADALKELREVVETPLLHPERFTDLGIDPPKGVLLYGPPGTGKTLSARAVANRTDATFIRVLGSELVQKYVGEGARIVRELFQLARSKKACIVGVEVGCDGQIFFDEVDSIGGTRFDGEGDSGDTDVQNTMLELVNQLDGFDARGNIKVLMATNRPRAEAPGASGPQGGVRAARPGGANGDLQDPLAPDDVRARHSLRAAGAAVSQHHGCGDPQRVHGGGHVRDPGASQGGDGGRLLKGDRQGH